MELTSCSLRGLYYRWPLLSDVDSEAYMMSIWVALPVLLCVLRHKSRSVIPRA